MIVFVAGGASTGDDLNEISKFYPGSTFSGSELFFLCIAVSVAAVQLQVELNKKDGTLGASVLKELRLSQFNTRAIHS